MLNCYTGPAGPSRCATSTPHPSLPWDPQHSRRRTPQACCGMSCRVRLSSSCEGALQVAPTVTMFPTPACRAERSQDEARGQQWERECTHHAKHGLPPVPGDGEASDPGHPSLGSRQCSQGEKWTPPYKRHHIAWRWRCGFSNKNDLVQVLGSSF